MKPTQEQVIAWAREAGFSHYKTKDFAFDRWLGRSEALEIAYSLAYEAGRESMKVDSIHTCHDQCQRPACIAVREAYEAGRKDENEACEQNLRDFSQTRMVPVLDTWRMGLVAGANAIRARREQ